MKAFSVPTSMDEAEQRKVTLLDQINDINAQLTARNGAQDAEGRYLEPAHDFFTWRSRAVSAKRHVESELRHLNLWIKQQRRNAPIHAAAAKGLDATDPVSLLAAAYRLLHRLACEGVDLDPDEQQTKDAICEYLNRPQPDANASVLRAG